MLRGGSLTSYTLPEKMFLLQLDHSRSTRSTRQNHSQQVPLGWGKNSRLCSLQGQSTKLKGNHGEKGAPQGELYADRQTVPSSQEALPEHICSEEEPPSPNGSLPLPWNCEPALTACYVHKLHTCRSTFKISKNTNCMLLNKTFAWLLFCEQYNPTTIYRAFTLH